MDKRLEKRHSLWKNDILNITKRDFIVINDYHKPWFVITPDNTYVEYWSRFMTMLLIYTALVTPYRVAFIEMDDNVWLVVEYMVSGFFFMDFCLNCFLAFYDREKVLIVEPKKIFVNYLFSWMIFDLFACLPFTLIFDSKGQYNSVVRVARLPRLYRLIKITKLLRVVKVMRNGNQILKHMNTLFKISASFERLFWFVFTYIVLIHLVTCMWVFLARIDSSFVNWINTSNFHDYQNFELYLVSLYWAVTTFATVGYGDIVPVNLVEKIYVCVVMTIGIIFYSYSISSLTNVLSNLDIRKSKLSQQYMTLDMIANNFKINSAFYQQISQALEYIYSNSHYDIDELTVDLPTTLSNQLLAVIYETKIKNNIFFEKKSTGFVGWVASRLKSSKMNPRTFLYHEGDYAHQMYFIIKGVVEFVIIAEKQVFPYLELGSDYYFGEMDLLFSEKKIRMNTVRTVEECEFLTLNCDNFFLLLTTFEDEAVEICMKSKDRLERANMRYIDALYNIEHKLPIKKTRSLPKNQGNEESHGRFSSYHPFPEKESPHKNLNLFNKIIETKYKIKDNRMTNIIRKIDEMEDNSYELRYLAEQIKDEMSRKYPRFKDKYGTQKPDLL